MNASNCYTGSVFLSSDIPSFPHSAVLLQWFLLVGRPAWLVFLSVSHVHRRDNWCKAKGLEGGIGFVVESGKVRRVTRSKDQRQSSGLRNLAGTFNP